MLFDVIAEYRQMCRKRKVDGDPSYAVPGTAKPSDEGIDPCESNSRGSGNGKILFMLLHMCMHYLYLHKCTYALIEFDKCINVTKTFFCFNK